jgi:hypothetical protein
MAPAYVVTVSASPAHRFSKEPREAVRLAEGLGVEGDSHAGTTVQHLSRVRRDGLPAGTVLRLWGEAEVEITGLRNPCVQIDRYSPGLLAEVVGRDEAGEVVRRAGVMGVVRRSGEVRAGDPLVVVLPADPHTPLAPV